MTRLLRNFLNGDLDTAVGSTDTTLSSPGFADLPVVSSPDVMALVLDPTGDGNGPEIVHVTDHTADSTNVTVTRGEEDTAAASHSSGTAWIHAATRKDIFGSLSRCQVARESAQSISSFSPVEWDTTRYNVGDLCTVGTDRITFSRSALILVSGAIEFDSTSSCAFRLSDSADNIVNTPCKSGSTLAFSGANTISVANGDYLQLLCGDSVSPDNTNDISMSVIELPHV